MCNVPSNIHIITCRLLQQKTPKMTCIKICGSACCRQRLELPLNDVDLCFHTVPVGVYECACLVDPLHHLRDLRVEGLDRVIWGVFHEKLISLRQESLRHSPRACQIRCAPAAACCGPPPVAFLIGIEDHRQGGFCAALAWTPRRDYAARMGNPQQHDQRFRSSEERVGAAGAVMLSEKVCSRGIRGLLGRVIVCATPIRLLFPSGSARYGGPATPTARGRDVTAAPLRSLRDASRGYANFLQEHLRVRENPLDIWEGGNVTFAGHLQASPFGILGSEQDSAAGAPM